MLRETSEMNAIAEYIYIDFLSNGIVATRNLLWTRWRPEIKRTLCQTNRKETKM